MGGVKYLSKLREIAEKNKEFQQLFHQMLAKFQKEYKLGIPQKIKDLMDQYVKDRIEENDEKREKQEEKMKRRRSSQMISSEEISEFRKLSHESEENLKEDVVVL